MFLRTRALCYIVHAPRGINFDLSADDAIRRIRDKYGRYWFGAQLDYLHLETPSKEFLPFYLCSGRIHASFVGNVSYSDHTTSGDGKSTRSSTRYVSTSLQTLDSVFEENKTQIYAGYKYSIAHVHHALRGDQLSYSLRKMYEVDTSGATINLFEQSTRTMMKFVEMEVRRQAEETACSLVRSFHPSADSVTVEFKEFTLHLDEVTPTFVPCFVVKAEYDAERYTLYVSGVDGQVGGPYLLNSVYIARTTALGTLATALFLVPNKVAGFFFGSVACVATYYVAFFAARWYPVMRRNWSRQKRERLRRENLGLDQGGYRPNTSSQHIEQEYRSSTYWDTHAYQQRRHTGSGGSRSASSSSSSSFSAHSMADPLGYYRALGLHGNESVNEIRSAYRRIVLKQHPDVGGSNEAMVKVNEAYRVLRDPKRRAAYDQS
ncbi:Dnaj domain protein, putative [Leishmania tarentolae]|uniref:Dnaj domain protein, putative n=1 Tax=Leishmania tarentolae TaxID=5689 RepID=A0A640KGV7_LEITA|nr:Dnaj domain protein, putative [Leishmania tarentolae]